MTDNEKATLTATAEVEGLTQDDRAEWLKSGELPSDKPAPAPKEEVPPPDEEKEDDKGKAAEEADQTKFQVRRDEKPNQMGYKALRDKVKELEAKLAESTSRTEPPIESRQPISTTAEEGKKDETKARPKPTPDAVDDAGKKKYTTYEDYLEDLADWKAEARLAAYVKEQTDNAQKARDNAALETVRGQWRGKIEAARKVHADFDAVALNDKLVIPNGSHVNDWILENSLVEGSKAAEVLYLLAKSPENIAALNAMTRSAAYRELVVLEAELTETDEPEKKADTSGRRAVSTAPPPAREVGSRQAVGYDPGDEALAEGDFEKYRKAENAKELKSKRR